LVSAELIKGSNGIYEVAVDGKVVVAKGLSGFPTEDAVVSAVREALAATGAS
jgi:hypothetical protein